MPRFARNALFSTPSDAALAYSAALSRHIAAALSANGGWLSFARYMELALYTPGLGYYSGGSHKFGAAGDFITAPELSPLFGQTLASQVAELMVQSAPQIVEVGAGSGALAAELLAGLERRGNSPERYAILELSGELRARQQETLRARVPQLAHRVIWLDRLPSVFSGVVLANEVLDAMPVQLVVWRGQEILERGVAFGADGRFAWEERLAQGVLREAALLLPVAATDTPYVSEINLAARAWVREWAHSLECGALLVIDYGFPQREYYHPQRAAGTLMCHYRHHTHEDPLWLPGLNDITAHVDFTAAAEAACHAGLDLLGYASQAQFLFNCGITEVLGRLDADDLAYLKLAAGVQKLISPTEMGELFKVMALGKGIAPTLLGFTKGDRSHTL